MTIKYTKEDAKAYISGFHEANSADADLGHNPYEKDTELYNEWNIGYEEAMNTIYLESNLRKVKMTTKYTQEEAFVILEAFRSTISGNEPIYVRVRSYGRSKTIARPFVPSTSTIYSAGFETPLECREHVIKELAKRAKNKMYEGENCVYNENREEDRIRELIGKCIEVGNRDKAMRLAVSINDKTLIAFITRLINTANKVY